MGYWYEEAYSRCNDLSFSSFSIEAHLLYGHIYFSTSTYQNMNCLQSYDVIIRKPLSSTSSTRLNLLLVCRPSSQPSITLRRDHDYKFPSKDLGWTIMWWVTTSKSSTKITVSGQWYYLKYSIYCTDLDNDILNF